MIGRLHALFVVTLCAISMAACGSDRTEASSSATPAEQRVAPRPAAPAPAPAKFTLPPAAYKGPLPPLPRVAYPLPRPPEVVQAVYTFAARHPEVLHYVPCFCGCQRSGHNDNDDCFIKSRDANGRPEWESHGMG
jgi:hypothetical protein